MTFQVTDGRQSVVPASSRLADALAFALMASLAGRPCRLYDAQRLVCLVIKGTIYDARRGRPVDPSALLARELARRA